MANVRISILVRQTAVVLWMAAVLFLQMFFADAVLVNKEHVADGRKFFGLSIHRTKAVFGSVVDSPTNLCSLVVYLVFLVLDFQRCWVTECLLEVELV